MKTVAIVQARMGSTRLPGKVLRPLGGRPMLTHVVERLRHARRLAGVVVATSTLAQDDPIVPVATDAGAEVFRGDEQDVLGRYVGAAEMFRADVIVRVTADCPLIDPDVVDEAVGLYAVTPDELDYVSNTMERTYPRGLDVEVFPRRILIDLHGCSTSADEREHVTLHLLHHPDHYRVAHVRSVENHARHYWTVDTAADFELMERIYEALYAANPCFGWRDVLRAFETRPEWHGLNRASAEEGERRLQAIDRGATR